MSATLNMLRIAQLIVGYNVYALNEAVRKQEQVVNGEVVTPVGDASTIIVDNAARLAGQDELSIDDLFDLACIAAGKKIERDGHVLETALQAASEVYNESFDVVYQAAHNKIVAHNLSKQVVPTDHQVAVPTINPIETQTATELAEEKTMSNATKNPFALTAEQQAIFDKANAGDMKAREELSLPVFNSLIEAAKNPLGDYTPPAPTEATINDICVRAHGVVQQMLGQTETIESLLTPSKAVVFDALPRIKATMKTLARMGNELLDHFRKEDGAADESALIAFVNANEGTTRGFICTALVGATRKPVA